MPKARNYKDIEIVFDPSDTNLTIKHQTGDAIIPCKGGASIVPLPCGGGKSTATCDLVTKRCDKGIVIFVATRADANDMKKRHTQNPQTEKSFFCPPTILPFHAKNFRIKPSETDSPKNGLQNKHPADQTNDR